MVEIDAEELLVNSLRDGLREAVKSKLTGYQSPFDNLIKELIAKYDTDFRSLLGGAINSAIGDEKFREEIRDAIRHNLAKTLVQRFGGELEKQVNALKSDPTTRARITLAIEEIVKSKT